MIQPDSPLRFKMASEEWEFEAIHGLNYRTFVEEIPQHAPSPERRLVDRFHAENSYAICLDGERLVAMVAGRGRRPFSLDHKLPDLDAHLPAGRKVLEIRLLAVEEGYRGGLVLSRLLGLLGQHFRPQGFDLAIISATTRQTRLYRHLGFVPFGPLVGEGDARFQPMYLTLETYLTTARPLRPPPGAATGKRANYLPGPVDVHEDVRRAFQGEPVSHRSDALMADFRSTRRMLCELTAARHVELLLGSGSLANDAVCAQISLLRQPGLIVSLGEFGERLIDHATRQGLSFEAYRTPWGDPPDEAEVRRLVARESKPGWLWTPHCETSTGILMDLAALKGTCAEHGVKLCLDGISSIGTVPVDLSGVYLASCVSGKALASFPGLSMVFYNHDLAPAPSLPRYLDLGAYAAESGMPFTQSSNLIQALQTALASTDWPAKHRRIAETGAWLRRRLVEVGLEVVAPEAHAAPAVVSIRLGEGVSSKAIGDQLAGEGCLLSYNSAYLLRRNWVQICLMGRWPSDHLAALPDRLAELAATPRA